MAISSFRRSTIRTTVPRFSNMNVDNIPNFSAFELIETQTVGSGGAASITFSNIPQGYKHLQIRGIVDSSDQFWYRINGDTGANYSSHTMQGTGSGINTASTVNATTGYFGYAGSTSQKSAIIFDILDYANTSKYKTTRHLNGNDFNGSGNISISSASWRSTNAITSIVLYPNTGSFSQHCTLSLYGVK